MCLIERLDAAATISEAFTLGQEIHGHFVDGNVSFHPTIKPNRAVRRLASNGVATVWGQLNLSHQDIATRVNASCSLCIPSNWMERSPALRCLEIWIRGRERRDTRPEWHINDDDSFCYVLDAEWKELLDSVRSEHGPEAAMTAAAYYCINNVRWLLFRHLEGYRRKLRKWPREWPQWAHYAAGLQDYLAQRHRQLGLK